MPENKTWKLWEDEKVKENEALLLRRRASELPIPLDNEARKDVETLVSTFLQRDDAAGLAAPQIGISKRIVVFKTKNLQSGEPVKDDSEYEVLINPRITQVRGDRETMREGCLSCPDISVEVPRYPSIKVKAYDRNGNKINKRYSGFLARVVQHEVDHLEGKLIIDRGTTIYYPQEKERFFESLFKK